MKRIQHDPGAPSTSNARNLIEASLGAIPVPVCLLSGESMTFANEAWLRMMRFAAVIDLCGKPFWDLAAEESRKNLLSFLQEAGESTAPTSWVCRLVRGDGTTISVEATAQPLRTSDAIILQITFKDWAEAESGRAEFTVREAAEVELARKKAQLQLILDNVPALIGYVDAEGRYQWVNRAYEKWYGLHPREVVGRRSLDVLKERIGEEYAERLRPKIEAALLGVQVTFEATHHFGGKDRNLVLTYSPDPDESGKVRGFVLMVTDFTEEYRARQELRASEQRFRTLAAALPSVLWTTTVNGEIDYLSERFTQITGQRVESGLGTAWLRVIHPEDVPGALTCWQETLASGEPLDQQYRVLQQDGSYRWFLARGLPQRNEAGEIVRWVGVSTDIHQQVLAEEAIRASEQRYRLLFEDNPHPMWTYDLDTLSFTSVNDAAILQYGYTREEFLRMSVAEIRPAEDVAAVMALLKNTGHTLRAGPLRHKKKDGSIFWVEVAGHPFSIGTGRSCLVLAQDVSERVRLEEELTRRAQHDSLTGLSNRRLLADRFEQATERAKRNAQHVALMTIDFDRFKQVNDTFGHQIGDEFLKAVAQRIRSRLRGSDTLARTGGDEFVVVAEAIDTIDGCMEVANALVESLREPVPVGDLEFKPTISVGLAIYPPDGTTLDDLTRRADYGLFHAKTAGRNCCKRYSTSERGGVQEAMQIERLLREALESGNFELHYQPLFSTNGELKSMEALVRLPHPELGLLSPARFIPIAEESGLISSIGLWVLREACRQTMEWAAQGFKVVPVAVNVSAAQFGRGDLAEEVKRVLEEFGMRPHMLELELTESLLMQNVDQSCQQLRLLKEIGVRIAVDDFGTGYSSLSYLHALPLDILKIDRSFIRVITAPGSSPIVKAIVELGKNLGLTIVAEGVETEVQFHEMKRLGCDLLQGYLFAVPECGSKISSFLTRGDECNEQDEDGPCSITSRVLEI